MQIRQMTPKKGTAEAAPDSPLIPIQLAGEGLLIELTSSKKSRIQLLNNDGRMALVINVTDEKQPLPDEWKDAEVVLERRGLA